MSDGVLRTYRTKWLIKYFKWKYFEFLHACLQYEQQLVKSTGFLALHGFLVYIFSFLLLFLLLHLLHLLLLLFLGGLLYFALLLVTAVVIVFVFAVVVLTSLSLLL